MVLLVQGWLLLAAIPGYFCLGQWPRSFKSLSLLPRAIACSVLCKY